MLESGGRKASVRETKIRDAARASSGAVLVDRTGR